MPRAAAAIVALAVACTPKAKDAPATATPADAAIPDASAAAAPVDAPHATWDAEHGPKSWMEPEAIAALAKDCAFHAYKEEGNSPDPSPLSCHAGLAEQSCSPDPCFDDVQAACNPGCGATCDGCTTTCAASFDACKSACIVDDDDCKNICATFCGACRQHCVDEKDTCATATCGAAEQACRRSVNARWAAAGCTAQCKPYVACLHACAEKDDVLACVGACEKSKKLTCDPRLLAAFCNENVGPKGPLPFTTRPYGR